MRSARRNDLRGVEGLFEQVATKPPRPHRLVMCKASKDLKALAWL